MQEEKILIEISTKHSSEIINKIHRETHQKTLTLLSMSSCESCSFQQRYLVIHQFQLFAHPDTIILAYPDQYMKPCTGREGCLLQTQLDDEMESYRKMVIQEEDLKTVKERLSKHILYSDFRIKSYRNLTKILKMKKYSSVTSTLMLAPIRLLLT